MWKVQDGTSSRVCCRSRITGPNGPRHVARPPSPRGPRRAGVSRVQQGGAGGPSGGGTGGPGCQPPSGPRRAGSGTQSGGGQRAPGRGRWSAATPGRLAARLPAGGSVRVEPTEPRARPRSLGGCRAPTRGERLGARRGRAGGLALPCTRQECWPGLSGPQSLGEVRGDAACPESDGRQVADTSTVMLGASCSRLSAEPGEH